MNIHYPKPQSSRHLHPLLPILLTMATLATAPAQAQLARKPSIYEHQTQPATQASPAAKPAFLPELHNQADFDLLARVYDPGTPMQLPHVIFVIDRKSLPVRIYYIDTPRFQLHKRFVRDTLLQDAIRQKPGIQRQIDLNYSLPDRRFLFGTLSWQKNISAFSYEFWEGDLLTAALLRQTDEQLKTSFFQPVRFKSNSTLHERRAAEAGIEPVTQEALIREQPYLPLNLGHAVGKVRLVESAAGVGKLAPDDIAVLRQVPLSLPPVAGVVTDRPSTALSHVNLLAKGWGIPNVYLRDAASVFKEYEGQWVELTAKSSNYTLRRLAPDEITSLLTARAETATRQAAPGNKSITSKPDLKEKRLLPLTALRARNSAQCGAKAANLGAMLAAHIPDTTVPDGFCIPFAHYERFMRSHNLVGRLAQMQQVPGFASDAQIRQTELAKLREEIVQWDLDTETTAAWRALWQAQLGGKGVFVRSSSNSEDLPGFSGAGLYSTVPNVKTAEALDMAVKKVWASVFNDSAWEARAAAGFANDAVLMGVFVQTAIDSVNSGVMITRDPFDAHHYHTTYISAKRGIGIRVVEGQRQAEQVMYSSWSKAIQVISRSADDTALQLDKAGGVKEVPLEVGRAVLTDELVLRLAKAGAAVKKVFNAVDQDIEWATADGRIVLLQARPYVERRSPAR